MDNKDIGIKSLFLGPKSENADWVREEISQIFSDWFTWRTSLYGDDGAIISDEDKNDPRFWQVRERIRNYLNMQSGLFRAEIPTYPPPRYIAHMDYSEISLPSLFGHVTALLYNCNRTPHRGEGHILPAE